MGWLASISDAFSSVERNDAVQGVENVYGTIKDIF